MASSSANCGALLAAARQWKENTCPISSLPTHDDFYQKYQFHTLIKESTDCQVWSVQLKPPKTGCAVCKLYKGDIQQRWREYSLMHYTKLLEYKGIFYDQKNEEIAIVMETLQFDLKTLMHYRGLSRKKPTNEFGVKMIAFDILRQLSILHRTNTVHCDLKPENIMRRDYKQCPENGYKIIDYGLMVENGTIKPWMGTIGWTAPEIDINSKENMYTFATDIWGFGLIILYLLSGEQCFDLTKEQRILYNKSGKSARKRMKILWYFNKFVCSETGNAKEKQFAIQNYLIGLVCKEVISVELFSLLHNGILVMDSGKRWQCKEVYSSKWFDECR